MTRSILLTVTPILILPLLHACVTTPTPPPIRSETSRPGPASSPDLAHRPDPSSRSDGTGTIIEARTGSTVSYEEMIEAIRNRDVIYLSEKHDNPMHHAIQHRIIQELVDRGQPPALGFEFFAIHTTPLLLSFMDAKRHPHPAAAEEQMETDLRQKLEWERQPDTLWQFYFDLLTLARDSGLVAAGLDLGTSQKRRITRKGLAGLTALERHRLFSTGLTHPGYAAHMKAIFRSVHCGMGTDDMVDRLYDTWVARNDAMARSITEMADTLGRPVVVIIGNGHTEYGLGVMDRVTALSPTLSQVNVALTEVAREPVDKEIYIRPLSLDGYPPSPPADFVWLTHRVSDEDPCDTFRKRLDRMNGPPASPKPPESGSSAVQ